MKHVRMIGIDLISSKDGCVPHHNDVGRLHKSIRMMLVVVVIVIVRHK